MSEITTPDQIAREIAEHFYNSDKNEQNRLTYAIAAALLDEYHRGIEEETVNCSEHCKEADADGYERGKKEIRDACTQHQHEQYAEGFRKGVEESAKVSKAQKHFDDAGMILGLLQRGQVGGEK